jgi:RNA polymerase sigma factor (sigma-70 family)
MTHVPDQILRRLAQRYASARIPYDDLVQEARIAAWKASLMPNATSVGFVFRAAKWAIFDYLSRERKETHLSLERDCCEVGSRLTAPDFAPALIDAMDRNGMQRELSRGDSTQADGLLEGDALLQSELTGAERTVLDWLCRGLEYKEIARTLECSVSVVRFHLVNIYRKLRCRNSVEAYTIAMQHGLVAPPAQLRPGTVLT